MSNLSLRVSRDCFLNDLADIDCLFLRVLIKGPAMEYVIYGPCPSMQHLDGFET